MPAVSWLLRGVLGTVPHAENLGAGDEFVS
jgi:hypothetical protein